jgi:hypothetical protein
MFGVFCIAGGTFVLFFLKETKGRSLEDMDLLFGAVTEEERRTAVETTMTKRGAAHAEYADEEAAAGQREEDKD